MSKFYFTYYKERKAKKEQMMYSQLKTNMHRCSQRFDFFYFGFTKMVNRHKY